MIDNFTHNIIVEIASSVDSNGLFTQFHPAVGSTFTSSYNETLDSATLILDHIPLSQRLVNIAPYQHVRIYDSTSWDEEEQKFTFDKIFLIDNYVEKETNINVHLFQYTINLMSETKYLEKIQCPSRTITHNVDSDGNISKNTIYEYIKRYCEQYIPKVKMYVTKQVGTVNTPCWEYQPIITVNEPIYSVDNVLIEYDLNGNLIKLKDSGFVINNSTNLNDLSSISITVSSTLETVGSSSIKYAKHVISFTNETDNIEMLLPDGFAFLISYKFDASEEEYHKVIFRVQGNTKLSPNETKTFTTKNIARDQTATSIYVSLISQYKEKVISLSGEDIEYSSIYKKFNVSCADLSFQKPTLRQLLTTLMQQVGCIPVVERGVLGYLDFNVDQPEFSGTTAPDFTVNNTVNTIQRALSSDSYVNSIVNLSSNVLDTNNEVISERIGFRDSSNVNLKQTSNLYLETKFPIYKIVNSSLITPTILTKFAIRTLTAKTGDTGVVYVKFLRKDWQYHSGSGGYLTLNVVFEGLEYDESAYIESNSMTLHLCEGDLREGFTEYANVKNTQEIVITQTSLVLDPMIVTFNIDLSGLTTEQKKSPDFIWIECEVKNSTRTKSAWKLFCNFNQYDDGLVGDSDLYSGVIFNLYGSASSLRHAEKSFNIQYDFTPFIIEESIRKNLEVNYKNMPSSATSAEEITKFVYGTVGYSIGSTRISGFSTTWSELGTSLGWFDTTKTYIENIFNNLESIYGFLGENKEDFFDLMSKYLGNMPIFYKTSGDSFHGEAVTTNNFPIDNEYAREFKYYNFATHSIVSSSNFNFVGLIFDIKYQPLNSFSLAFSKSKKDIDYPIEQYDGGAGGVTDFDRLSLNEQEVVDRVGEETVNIGQRTSNYSDIQDIPSIFKDVGFGTGKDNTNLYCTIFQREIAINNYYYDVRYTGTKDAILKNYFTSIRTKYRAFQYVDYSQSTQRQERDTVYVRISENYYNGDDKIWLGKHSTVNGNKYYLLSNFLNGVLAGSKTISYEIDSGTAKINYHSFDSSSLTSSSALQDETIYQNQKIKNEVSLISNNNGFALIYSQPDNVSGGMNLLQGMYVENETLYQLAQGVSSGTSGVPQQWQIWDDTFQEKHKVVFSYPIFENDFSSLTAANDIEIGPLLNKVTMYPVINRIYDEKIEDMFDSGTTITDTSNFEYDLLDFENSDNMAITLVDKNDGESFEKTFYKDGAEVLQHTVQFIYYTDSSNIIWTENFIANNGFISKNKYLPSFYMVYGNNDRFEVNNQEYQDYDSTSYSILRILSKISIVTDQAGESYIKIDWSSDYLEDVLAFKLVWKYGSYTYRDIIAFRRDSLETTESYFYVSLNDTKSDYVLDRRNGVLYRRAVVEKLNKDGSITTGGHGKSQVMGNRTAVSLYSDNFPITGYTVQSGTEELYYNTSLTYDYTEEGETSSGNITHYDL